MNRDDRPCSVARRRVLGGLVLAPLLARAAAAQKRLAVFLPWDDPDVRENLEAIVKALAARGWAEGPRLQVLLKFDNRGVEGLDAAAGEVVAWRPDVILTEGSIPTAGLMRATRTIPIVASVSDPVASGFARSLAAPGGNFTGLSQGGAEAAVKRIELLLRLVPKLRRLAIERTDLAAWKPFVASVERAARAAGIEALPFDRVDGTAMIRLLGDLRARGVQAVHFLAVSPDEAGTLAAQGIRLRLPLVSKDEKAVEAGMLASVDNDSSSGPEQEAAIVERILLGASPAQLPIQFPDKFRTVVNRRTAEAIGIKLTAEVLLRADRVID
jgi:putative ABC transport system substrate-binding protein